MSVLKLFIFTVLNKLIARLDKRGTKYESTKQGFKKKFRVLGSPSSLSPPSNPPSWAVVEQSKTPKIPPASDSELSDNSDT